MTPILGVVQTPKMDKLLRHILDAVKMHGNLHNGNTGGNEAQHKQDKAFYRRANKTIANVAQQVVRQAQGSREVSNALKSQEAEAERSFRATIAAAAAARGQVPTAAVPRMPPPGTDGAAGGSRLPTMQPAEASGSAAAAAKLASARRGRVRSLPRKSVAVLCHRPGLSRLGQVLGLPALSTLKALNGPRIAARLDCGTLFSQAVRATPAHMSKPWYDAVLLDGADAAAQDEAGQHQSAGMLFGEVRLMFRGAEEDMAVVCLWEAVSLVPGCPLAARSCKRLRWSTAQAGNDFCARVSPTRRIWRLVHVVPDFADLARSSGVEAIPPARTAATTQHRGMKFFVNDFFPWA